MRHEAYTSPDSVAGLEGLVVLVGFVMFVKLLGFVGLVSRIGFVGILALVLTYAFGSGYNEYPIAELQDHEVELVLLFIYVFTVGCGEVYVCVANMIHADNPNTTLEL